MSNLFGRGMLAAAPVFGVSLSIAVLRAAHAPFPPELSLSAWPQWAVFCAVVHTFTALCMFAVGRIFGEAPPTKPASSRPVA